MALTTHQYPGNGIRQTFPVPFPYLSRDHVKVKVDGNLWPYEWLSPSQIRLRGITPAVNSIVEVYRETKMDTSLVTFRDGAVLTQQELNTSARQNFYLIQELRERYDAALQAALVKIAIQNGVVVTDPAAIIAELVQGVLNSELLAELNTRIADIDYAGQTALEALGIAGLMNTRTIQLEQDTSTIRSELTSSVTELGVLTGRVDTIGSDLADNSAAIQTVQITLTDAIAAVAAQVQTLQATTGNLIFTQPTEPIPGTDFDPVTTNPIWYNTSDNNHPHRWNGSDFVSVRDQLISSALARITTEEGVRASADGALSTRIDTLFSVGGTGANYVSAAVQTETVARTSQYNSLASSVSTLQSTVNGHTASISTQQTTIDGVKAQYMVKLDVNGWVSGFGLYNNGAGADGFIVNASSFAVAFPGKTKQIPFVVGNVKGVSTVGITGQLIVDGTIEANAIKANSILAGHIQAGAVDFTQLADGAIRGAKIQDAAIVTSKIAANAVVAASIAAGSVSADKMSVGYLSAISANLGTVTAGTLQTATGTATRAEMSSDGEFPLWFGTGAKSAANAKFYLDRNGNAFFAGNLAANSVTVNHILAGAATKSTTAVNQGSVANPVLTATGSSGAHDSMGYPTVVFFDVDVYDSSSTYADAIIYRRNGGPLGPITYLTPRGGTLRRISIPGTGAARTAQQTFIYIDAAPPSGTNYYSWQINFGAASSYVVTTTALELRR